MLAAHKLSDEFLYSWVDINSAVVCRCNDHVSQLAVQVRFLLPEVTIDPKDGREQIARVKVTFGEWVLAQVLQRDRYEISQTDLLLDHQPQVFDSELVDRLTPQRMAPTHQPCALLWSSAPRGRIEDV
jgi:hypothetical protein